MPKFLVHVDCELTERYEVEAESKQEAIDTWHTGMFLDRTDTIAVNVYIQED